jgi:predicted DsbA family dithiol-disulfide isomerase
LAPVVSGFQRKDRQNSARPGRFLAFTGGRDVSDRVTLAEIASEAGLDRAEVDDA